MLCPYCLDDIQSSAPQCPACEHEVPELYKRNYPRGGPFSRPRPVVLSAVGFSGHGKTVYLAALLHTLENELTRVWPGFYRQGLDRDTIREIKRNLQDLERGELPESTRRNFPQPSLHRLAKLPRRYGDRVLVAYDPPGEAFEEDLSLEQYAHFVKRAQSVVFLLSLPDLEEPLAHEMHRFLEVYTLAMARMRAPTRKQHLVVTFTKADTLLETRFKQFPDLVQHLSNPSYAELGDLDAYQRRLENVSRELEDFTRNVLEARNFDNLAREAFKSVVYCAVSALGSAPEGARLKDKMTPLRVADPLLWVLARG